MCLYFEPIAVLALNQSLPCQHTNLRAIKKEELHPVYYVESGQDEVVPELTRICLQTIKFTQSMQCVLQKKLLLQRTNKKESQRFLYHL